MERINENDLFRTTDLSLAAAISMGLPLEAMDRSKPEKVIFYFKREKNLDEVVQGFWDKTLKIEPRTYYEAIKALKYRIYG